MKFLTIALVFASLGAIQVLAIPKYPSQDCYNDSIPLPCAVGMVCAAVQIPVLACPSNCSNAVKAGCTKRCKPCRTKPCTKICTCEIVCPLNTPSL
ncbi:hypothetical protein BX661DRAFT_184472, partial [Kickxella alabastrina]|uniref:uncharacterized protein n=1 Tax=Kickxella alabastrina TaxID=61397 RepID=UPI0022204D3F